MKKIIMFLRFWLYLKLHPVEELEAALWRMGCQVVVSRKGNIYHLPKGGKIIVSGEWVEFIGKDVKEY